MNPLDKTRQMLAQMFPMGGGEDEIPTADMLVSPDAMPMDGEDPTIPQDLEGLDFGAEEEQPPMDLVAEALTSGVLAEQQASRQYQDEVEQANTKERQRVAQLRSGGQR